MISGVTFVGKRITSAASAINSLMKIQRIRNKSNAQMKANSLTRKATVSEDTVCCLLNVIHAGFAESFSTNVLSGRWVGYQIGKILCFWANIKILHTQKDFVIMAPQHESVKDDTVLNSIFTSQSKPDA